jgi:hypothetical protein
MNDEQTHAPAHPIRVETIRRIVTVRLVVWMLFGVVFGLLPLAAAGLRDAMSQRGFHLAKILEGGELFVVAAALAAGAGGELIGAAYRGERSLTVILAGFACTAMLTANVMGYMLVAGSVPHIVVTLSLWAFVITLIASGVAIGTAARWSG